MGGLRNYGYKLNLGITEKRKRLKKLSKTIKLLSDCILKIDIDFPDDFGWKTPNGDFKSDNRLIRIQEDLQSLSSIYQEEELKNRGLSSLAPVPHVNVVAELFRLSKKRLWMPSFLTAKASSEGNGFVP